MRLDAILFHKEGIKVTEEQVFKALKEHGYTKGIMRKNIQEAILTPHLGLIQFAQGTPPKDDTPATLELFFDSAEDGNFSNLMEQMTVDTRKIKNINITDRNQLLVVIGAIVPGINGYNIKGESIQKLDRSEEEPIKFGPGVYLADNGKELYAKEAGHIIWKTGERYIDVEALYIVEGDVDYNEGNVHGFVGKVLVKGDVKPKFSVHAEGDVEVLGSVENAIVESEKGDVIIRGSIVHQQEGHVQAKNTVFAGIATNAVIRADKIHIGKEALNCELEAEKDIIIDGTPGVVMGGSIRAKQLIKANIIGSESWVDTKVHVGDITELKKKSRKIQQSLLRNKNRLKEAHDIVELLEKRAETNPLSSEQEEQLKKAQEEVPFLEDEIEYEENLKETVEQEIEAQKDARLEVAKTVYPGTDIHIYDATLYPQSSESVVGFRAKNGLVMKYQL